MSIRPTARRSAGAPRRRTAAALAAVLLLAACGSSDDDAADDGAATSEDGDVDADDGAAADPATADDAGTDDEDAPDDEDAAEDPDDEDDPADEDGEAGYDDDGDAQVEAAAAAPPDIVRGAYTTVHSFWGERWQNLMRLVRDTELNALVIDVKDEGGLMLWDLDHPIAQAAGGGKWAGDKDPRERLQELRDAGGYPIARVSCFKDTQAARARPDLAVQDANGNVWRARKDFSWLNPYMEEAGQYCIDIGLAAIDVGFAEVQFDYIRFPNGGDGNISGIRLPGAPPDRPRELLRHSDPITDFLARASEQIHDVGGFVSADIFGLTTYDFSWDGGGTGQVIERIAEHVDVISPMVYPSHYGPDNYDLNPHPVDHAYETIWHSMQEAQMRTQGLKAKIRPWIEDFAPVWMGRGHSPARLEEQMRAVHENGIEGWLLWNAGNSFSESALDPGEAVSKADPDFVPPLRTANPGKPPDAPGEERVWPGMPECDQHEGVLQIGDGNLAGTRPGEPRPPYVERDPETGECPYGELLPPGQDTLLDDEQAA